MASLNRVLLIGNLTKDPEVRYLPSGSPVADLRGPHIRRKIFRRYIQKSSSHITSKASAP